MGKEKPYGPSFVLLGLALLFSWLLNISSGSVDIPFDRVLSILWEGGTEQTWNYIIWEYRIPKALTAILVGSGLALSGLLMQTLFRSLLACPFVLGISAGASLGFALLLLGTCLVGGLATLSLVRYISLD